jgi:hypothetical protein
MRGAIPPTLRTSSHGLVLNYTHEEFYLHKQRPISGRLKILLLSDKKRWQFSGSTNNEVLSTCVGRHLEPRNTHSLFSQVTVSRCVTTQICCTVSMEVSTPTAPTGLALSFTTQSAMLPNSTQHPLLDKLIIVHLVKKSPAFYGTRRSITALTHRRTIF